MADDGTFNVAQAAKEISALLATDESTEDRQQLREGVLAALLPAGFERARFYERCLDNARGGAPILVLVAETEPGNCNDPKESNVGEYVDDEDSILGYEIAEKSVFVGDPDNFDELPDWYVLLEMEGRHWIDIALRAGENVVGVIAVDWSDKREVNEEALSILAAIGMMVGSHLQLRPPGRVRQFRNALTTSTSANDGEPRDPTELLVEGTKIIGNSLDARLVAIFEYVWTAGKLYKRFEIDMRNGQVSDGVSKPFFTDHEVWKVGEKLTGTAWEQEIKRHIPVFENLKSNLADKESKKRHAAYMGEEVNTCLYGYVGGTEPRYMLRFINRSRGGFMPFVGEAALLHEMLAELRSDLDACIAMSRTRDLELATRSAAEAAKPPELIEKLTPLVAKEGVDNFAFLCHQGSPHFAYHCSAGSEIERMRSTEGQEWEKDNLYASLATGQAAETRKVAAHRNDSALARQLDERGFDRVVSFPFRVGDTVGTLLIPTGEGSGLEQSTLTEKCGASRLSLFHAYARLTGDVVDSSIAHERAEGARRALGVLGHELASPLANLGVAAAMGLEKAHDDAAEAQARIRRDEVQGSLAAADRIRSNSAAYLERVGESRRRVGAAMALAPIVAKENNGRLELQFWKFNLGQLVFRAVDALEEELRRSLDVPAGREYDFALTQSVLRLGETVGDEALLQHALLNLLRNAVKYSMTPGGGSNVCPIGITTEPQKNMNIIVVHNWGRGILPEQMDAIFQPWTRYDDDAQVARRGMGLGLFITKRIALAHGGSVLCRRSVPSLSEISRQARLDGYDTEFELRLPKDYTEGAYVHTWHAGEPIRKPELKTAVPLDALRKTKK